MIDERILKTCEVSPADVLYGRPLVERQTRTRGERGPWSYQRKLGRETIWLSAVEYRILQLLAGQPYRAFTSRRIAKAVSTKRHPVVADTVSRHIASLRVKLGFFADYIQSVPHLGYRFKA